MSLAQHAKALNTKLAKGYNTWDVQSVTSHVYLPQGLRFNIAYFNTKTQLYQSNHLWDSVISFGEHAANGSYTDIHIRFEDSEYRIQTASLRDELLIKVTPTKASDHDYVALEVGEITARSFNYRYKDDTVIAYTQKDTFTARSTCPIASPIFHPITCPNLMVKADRCVYFTVNSSKDNQAIDQAITTAYDKWMASTIGAEGDLGEGLTAMRRSLLWNTVYDFKNQRIITPVSRNWCKRLPASKDCQWAFFGDYMLFGWDTFFAGLQFGLIDKDLAYLTIFSILQEQLDNGMIPNFGSGAGSSYDRSEPPVGALCVWKLYLQYQDEWFVEACFDALLRWNHWRHTHRDKNNDGLFELGSDPYEHDDIWNKHIANTKAGAMFESGLDNSPMWDDAKYNENLHAMELSYVGLNALMALDCELLAKMATLLGREAEARDMQRKYESLNKAINHELWDAKGSIYKNKHWDGLLDDCIGLPNLYPLIAGIVPDDQVDPMIDGYLLNKQAFWGKHIFPTVTKATSSYSDQDYWRGRIWAPTNYLIAQGLIRYGLTEAWDACAKKGLKLFIQCWKSRGVVGENYNAITGEAAEGDAASDRFYHWGALLVYICVERIVCFNAFKDGIEKPPKPDWLSGISNVPIHTHKENL